MRHPAFLPQKCFDALILVEDGVLIRPTYPIDCEYNNHRNNMSNVIRRSSNGMAHKMPVIAAYSLRGMLFQPLSAQ
jgi:hypothetical protein